MAIVINHNPPTYASAHGDLLFSVYEATKALDPVTYPQYKYVCDIYIAGVLITRTKVWPHPVHKRGVFNIAPIVRAYVAAQLNPAAGIEAQELALNEFYIDVVCKFGEEYDLTTYTNLTVDSTRRYYNHYNGQITGDETILDSFTDKPLSNRPSTGYVRLTDPYFFVPYFVITGTNLGIAITTYDAAGNSINNDSTTLTVSNGTMQLLNLSPIAVDATFPTLGILDPGVAYYEVEIEGTTWFTFHIKCEAMHTPYTLHFLNQFGGFESICFNKKSSKMVDIEKKDFTKLPYTVNSSTGAIEYKNAGNVVNETKSSYASRYMKKLRLSTDFLTDAEWVWLKELAISPNVFITEGSNIIPVTLNMPNYEEKKFINEKTINPLVIDLEYGVSLNAQYR
jgi:hypothetical protein